MTTIDHVTVRFPHTTVTGRVARHCLGTPLFLAEGLDDEARHTAYAVTNILNDLQWDGEADGIADSSGCITENAFLIDGLTVDGENAAHPDPGEVSATLTDLVHTLGLTVGGCVLAGSDPRLADIDFAPWSHGRNVWWHRVPADPLTR